MNWTEDEARRFFADSPAWAGRRSSNWQPAQVLIVALDAERETSAENSLAAAEKLNKTEARLALLRDTIEAEPIWEEAAQLWEARAETAEAQVAAGWELLERVSASIPAVQSDDEREPPLTFIRTSLVESIRAFLTDADVEEVE